MAEENVAVYTEAKSETNVCVNDDMKAKALNKKDRKL